MPRRRWRGTIAVEGTETGDHRIFEVGALRYRSLPRDFGVVFQDGGWGHENAIVVGTVDVMRMDSANLYAEGTFAEGDAEADRAANLMRQGALRGVSVDVTAGRARYEIVDGDGNVLPDDVGIEVLFDPDFPGYVREVWEDAEVGSLVSVRTPAFAETLIEYFEEGDAEQEQPAAGESDSPAPDAVAASAGGVSTPTPRPVRLAAALARAGRRAVVTASGAGAGAGAVLRASVAWDGGPPPEFFAPLDLDGPTPMTVTDDGEVFGHIAAWGQCHAGFIAGAFGQCLTPPTSPSEYRTFRANRQVRCSDGSRVACGVLTMDTTHAPAGTPERRPSLATVLRHYEDTGLIAAFLCAYDDAHGVQVHGVLREGLSIDDVSRAMAAAPSGDWRDYGAGLDLAGVLLVNQPGYPLVERDNGRTYALMASLAPRTAAASTGECAGEAGSCTCGCSGAPAGEAAHDDGLHSDPVTSAAPPVRVYQSARLRRRSDLERFDRVMGRS